MYYIAPRKWKNVVLMVASLFFYVWGGVSLSVVLFASIIGNYLFGRWIGSKAKYSTTKIPLITGVVFNLLMIGVAKYAGFVIENINFLLINNDFEPLKQTHIILPLGISFFTFQAMSYLIDVFRKETPVQRNFFKLALYISFFPQLIAGPIVRYHDIANQLTSRKESWSGFSIGIERFILGLIKKVIVANQFAIIANEAFKLNPDLLSQQLAWAGVISFSFQIYFDFAGYSDMAVGLGLMFGFKLPENFNYPYTAFSIREFWRRWHMTLGQWLRDYLYIPLGGNRSSVIRTYINLVFVFTLCGLWHGASWNFVVWGLVHGLFMAIERLWLEKNVLLKIGKVFSSFYTFFVATLAWVFFQTESFSNSAKIFKILFTGNPDFSNPNLWFKMFHVEFLIIAIPAILGAFGFFKWINHLLENKINNLSSSALLSILKIVGLVLSMVIITILLISDTYNPFIYFRF